MQLIIDNMGHRFTHNNTNRKDGIDIFNYPTHAQRFSLWEAIEGKLYADKRSLIAKPKSKGHNRARHKEPAYCLSWATGFSLYTFKSLFMGNFALIEYSPSTILTSVAYWVPVFELASDFTLWQVICQNKDPHLFYNHVTVGNLFCLNLGALNHYVG